MFVNETVVKGGNGHGLTEATIGEYFKSLAGLLIPCYTLFMMRYGSYLEAPHNMIVFYDIGVFSLRNLVSLIVLFHIQLGVESSWFCSFRDISVKFLKGLHTTFVLEYAVEVMYVISRRKNFTWCDDRDKGIDRKKVYFGIAFGVATLTSILIWSPGGWRLDGICTVARGIFEQTNAKQYRALKYAVYNWFTTIFYSLALIITLCACIKLQRAATTQQKRARALAWKLILMTFVMAVPAELQTALQVNSLHDPDSLFSRALHWVRDMYGIFVVIYVVLISKPLQATFCLPWWCFQGSEEDTNNNATHGDDSYVELSDKEGV